MSKKALKTVGFLLGASLVGATTLQASDTGTCSAENTDKNSTKQADVSCNENKTSKDKSEKKVLPSTKEADSKCGTGKCGS